MNSAIEDYGLIGDCESAALVARNGSIDWLCWPRFDSDACFAALLGTPDNGRWLLAPASNVKNTSRKYRDHTLILETRFETVGGAVTVIDFMPPSDRARRSGPHRAPRAGAWPQRCQPRRRRAADESACRPRTHRCRPPYSAGRHYAERDLDRRSCKHRSRARRWACGANQSLVVPE